MTSKDYTMKALGTTLRALNTMEGLLVDAQEPIPADVLKNQAPSDVKNCENLSATFCELETLREGIREIINAVMLMYEDDTGATAAELLDSIGENETNLDKFIDEILEKYDGDTVSDEF